MCIRDRVNTGINDKIRQSNMVLLFKILWLITLSDYIGKFFIETLEVQSNDTTEWMEFDSVLNEIQGKLPFAKKLHNFGCSEIENYLAINFTIFQVLFLDL